MSKLKWIILFLILQTSVFCSDETVSKEFVLKVAKAQIITDTKKGALYDSELGTYFMSLPETESTLR